MHKALNEELLYYCWQLRKWNHLYLKTTANETVEVLQPGFFHRDSGPDFLNAKVKIGNTVWSGNVEMHVQASDWAAHRHGTDKSYDSVILHVVGHANARIYRTDGTEIPTVEVVNEIPENIWQQYHSFVNSTDDFPCAQSVHSVPELYQYTFLNRVVVERLEHKSKHFLEILAQTGNQWEESLYIWVARAFGFKINALPFELLARSLPQRILGKYKSNQMSIEALLFGNAGFLNHESANDAYMKQLSETYGFLKRKHSLNSLDSSIWRFLRLRPSNFPTRRLAQFSAFIYKSQHLFSKVLEVENVSDFKKFFQDLPVHNYWRSHYRFNVESKESSVQLGEKSVESLILNAIIVFLFTYGQYFSQQQKMEKALNLLEVLKAEYNHITKMYENAGLKIRNALHSQAILQLHKEYCKRKKCISCGIGAKLIS